MARRTGIRDVVAIRHRRRNKAKRVGVNVRARNPFAFDLGHMARNAFVAGAPCWVMRVFLKGRRVRTIGRLRAVTVETELTRRFS